MADLQRRAKVRIPSHELLLADNSQHMNNTSSTNRAEVLSYSNRHCVLHVAC